MRFPRNELLLCITSVVVARLAFACVGDDPETVTASATDGGNDGSATDGAAPGAFTLTLDPTSASVRAGATVTFKARVVRQPGANGALSLGVPTGLPAGVSVTSDGIAENASEGTVTLTALPSASLGTTKLTVRAESFDRAFFQTATLDLTVRGASGTLDSTFGTGGITTFGVATGSESYASSVVVDAKGLVVVGGYVVATGTQSPVVFRLTSNGAPDTTFGTGGRAPVTLEGHVSQVALDATGRIVAVGDTKVAGVFRNATYRYTAAGAPDTTFGGTGMHVSAIANTATSSLNALAFVGTDIVAVGAATPTTAGVESQIAVVQLTNGGTDKQPGFYFQPGPSDEAHPLVDLADDGKGTLITLDGQQAAYTFVPGPLTALAPKTSLLAFRMAVTPAGKIVALSGTRVRRFTPTFVVDGLDQTVGFVARTLLVQPDDRIVIGGVTPAGELTITRLLPNGTADADFAGGVVNRAFPVATTVVGMTRTSDDKLVVVAGPTATAPKSPITVLRFWL